MSVAVNVTGLGKRFRRYSSQRPRTLQEAFLSGFRNLRSEEYFWAIRDVNLSLDRGTMIGLIGRNGAGKSTLLNLIGGVGLPDEGNTVVNGRIGALIELGAGFHPDLTGRENVIINGVISGLTRREVKERFAEIVRFAGMEDFIESPLRTYSTGMQMRLAFSVAVHIDPDILLIDEVLAVGDLSFQRKCLERITEFKKRGCSIILVSHDINLVSRICDEVIWLESGKIVAHGPAGVVASQYIAAIQQETERRTPADRPPARVSSGRELRVKENRFGSLEMEILDVHLIDRHGNPASTIESGEALCIELEYTLPPKISQPIFGVTIAREDGLVCFDTSTSAAGLQIPVKDGKGKIRLYLERLDLSAGDYYVDVGVYKSDWSYAYDYHWRAYPLTIQSTSGEQGVLRPPFHWEVKDIPIPASRSGIA